MDGPSVARDLSCPHDHNQASSSLQTQPRACPGSIFEVRAFRAVVCALRRREAPVGWAWQGIIRNRWKPDLDSAYFFDRNPKYVEYILDVLRQRAAGFSPGVEPQWNTEAFSNELDLFSLSQLFPDSPIAAQPVRIPVTDWHVWSADFFARGRIATFCGDSDITLDCGAVLNLARFSRWQHGVQRC